MKNCFNSSSLIATDLSTLPLNVLKTESFLTFLSLKTYEGQILLINLYWNALNVPLFVVSCLIYCIYFVSQRKSFTTIGWDRALSAILDRALRMRAEAKILRTCALNFSMKNLNRIVLVSSNE